MGGVELETAGSRQRVTLGPVLDMRVAEQLKDTLIEAIRRGGTVAIGAGMVERMSTACVQVLLAAAQTMRDVGIDFVLVSPTDAFVAAFSDLGLYATLLKWKVEE